MAKLVPPPAGGPPNSVTTNLVINGFSPSTGLAADPSINFPGDQITITGTGFLVVDPAKVKFNGTAAVNPIIQNDSTILARVPQNAISGKISVTDLTNNTAYSADSFTVKVPPPMFANPPFKPTMGIVGTLVTLFGKHFKSVQTVAFNGQIAQNPMLGANQQIEVNVPAGATTGPIRVSGPAGGATSPIDFIVIQPPVLTSVVPSLGPPGTKLTLSGRHLGEVTAVEFILGATHTPALFKDKTEKSMKVTVPSVPAGQYTIKVHNDAGDAFIGFTVTA
jgi:hypothetical protein